MRALAILLTLFAPLTYAAVITPTSYTVSPTPNASYPDTGGTELTDGILATGLVNNAADGAPYVAWLNQGPVTLTFSFNQSYTFTSVELGVLCSDLYNFAGVPSLVSVSGQDFAFSSTAIPDGGRSFLLMNPTGLTANSVTLQITPRTGLWLMIDEVRFDGRAATSGEIPEPSSIALAVAGLAALAGLKKIRK